MLVSNYSFTVKTMDELLYVIEEILQQSKLASRLVKVGDSLVFLDGESRVEINSDSDAVNFLNNYNLTSSEIQQLTSAFENAQFD